MQYSIWLSIILGSNKSGSIPVQTGCPHLWSLAQQYPGNSGCKYPTHSNTGTGVLLCYSKYKGLHKGKVTT